MMRRKARAARGSRRDILRVVLVGPESTGKSVLAQRLAGHYGTTFAPEFLRAYVRRRERGRHDPLVRPSDTRAIVKGHVTAEDRALRRARRVVFFDTNPLQSIVYYEHYFERRRPSWLEHVLQSHRYDLYLLLDVDVPWVEDGPRDRPLYRKGMHRLFSAALRSRNLPFVRIFGTWSQRRRRAIRAVDGLLAGR